VDVNVDRNTQQAASRSKPTSECSTQFAICNPQSAIASARRVVWPFGGARPQQEDAGMRRLRLQRPALRVSASASRCRDRRQSSPQLKPRVVGPLARSLLPALCAARPCASRLAGAGAVDVRAASPSGSASLGSCHPGTFRLNELCTEATLLFTIQRTQACWCLGHTPQSTSTIRFRYSNNHYTLARHSTVFTNITASVPSFPSPSAPFLCPPYSDRCPVCTRCLDPVPETTLHHHIFASAPVNNLLPSPCLLDPTEVLTHPITKCSEGR
jgi:hypothetical protein